MDFLFLNDLVTNLNSSYGLFGIFLIMFIETVIPIIPSSAVLPLEGYSVFNSGQHMIELIKVALIATTGSTLGSIVLYWIARKIGRYSILRIGKYLFFDESKLIKMERWFEKYGTKSVFICRLIPGMRELISLSAGLAKMNFVKYILFTYSGSLIWSFLLISLGFYFGDLFFEKKTFNFDRFLDYIPIFVLIILVSYFVYRYVIKRKLLHNDKKQL